MDPRYEFVSSQQKQLVTLSLLTIHLRSCQKPNQALWVQMVCGCGDLLIGFGSWMKSVSHSANRGAPVGLSPQK